MERRVLDSRDDWQTLKEGDRIAVYKTQYEGRPAVVKEYRLRNWLNRLSFASKAKTIHAFYSDRELAASTAPSLLLAESDRRSGRFCYEYIEGRDFREIDWKGQDEASSVALMQQSARLLGNLHDRGWIHGDFKFGNLLCSAAESRLYLLDIEAVRRSGASGKRARDVARFLLNGLELGVAELALSAFWQCYQQTVAGRKVAGGAVKQIVNKLAQRHERHYGRRTNADSLSFL